ncbi:MAG: GxxExxY protein [Acidobacteria bacterium]|nr:MAG: GxxExxY protein [Acidobacteriota bacterium]
MLRDSCGVREATLEVRMSDHASIIKEIAEDVYNTLGSGFSEDVYDRAMQVGLRLAKIGYEGQKVVELKYKDHYVGEGYPDLVVHLGNETLIVELKAISGELGASEEQQLRNYMTILKVQRGMLINFQQPGRKQGKTKLDIRELAL